MCCNGTAAFSGQTNEVQEEIINIEEATQSNEENFASPPTAETVLTNSVPQNEEVEDEETNTNTQNEEVEDENRNSIAPQNIIQNGNGNVDPVTKMRKSDFGLMVAKSKELPNSIENPPNSMESPPNSKTPINLAVGATETMDAVKRNLDIENLKDTTEEKTKLISNITAITKVCLFGAVSVQRLCQSFSKNNDSVGKKALNGLLPIFKIIAMLTETVGTFLKNKELSNHLINFSKAFQSLMSLIEFSLDYSKIKRRLAKFKELSTSSQGELSTVQKDLSARGKTALAKMISTSLQLAAEVTYASLYLKNPNNSKLMLASKLAVSTVSGMNAKSSSFISAQKGSSETYQTIADKEMEKFQTLYSDSFFLGTHETTVIPREGEENALKQYQNVENEFKALDIPINQLKVAKSKEDQKKLIQNAVGN